MLVIKETLQLGNYRTLLSLLSVVPETRLLERLSGGLGSCQASQLEDSAAANGLANYCTLVSGAFDWY